MQEWEAVARVRHAGVCRVRGNQRQIRDRLVSPELHQWIWCEVGVKRENEVDSECLTTAPM